MQYSVKLAFPVLVCCLGLPGSDAPATAVNREFHRRAAAMFKLGSAGRYLDAISSYRQAADDAEKAGEVVFAQKFLNNLGACQLAIFRYRDALNTLERARAIAEKSSSPQFMAEINLNISSLFLQLGDVENAAISAERGMIYVTDGRNSIVHAKLLIQLATVRARQKNMPAAERLFAQGIDAAYDARNPTVAAMGWEYLAAGYLADGRFADADRVLTEAFRLRVSFHLPNLNSYWELALVRAHQGDLTAANALIDRAVLSLKEPGNVTPPWKVYGARGSIRLLSADPAGALNDLRTAREMARSWRAGIVANDASRTAAESQLSDLFYSSLIQAANELYEHTHDPALMRETFEAVEENRAASLRALANKADVWRDRLPIHYWELLSQLQAAETRNLQQGTEQTRHSVALLRSELDRLEASAGSPGALDNSVALIRARRGLDANSVLLSFHLGEPDSWLWAVTSNSFALYRLPARSKMVPAIHAFRTLVHENSPDAARSGAALYQALFSSASPSLLAHRRWLLALDEDLFNLPFAALVPETQSAHPTYLAERHSLQIVTGALMLSASSAAPSNNRSFLGVGDAIYNRADSRWHEPAGSAPKFFQLRASTVYANSSPTFARLWGSGQEIRSSAAAWNGDSQVLLTGANASKTRVWKELAARPAVIHFATHILEAGEKLNTGWIAVSLNRGGQSEFIEPAEISARSVPARLVVLSGCSSGSAEIRTASGLMGLTRAFIAAGAGSVLATRWPTVDDQGVLLTAFYRHLRDTEAGGPAEALRQAQLDAIRTGGWRGQPSSWSGYFVNGN